MAQRNVLKYIILGLLAHTDRTGYDIKKLFEGELGDFWYANHSQIYPELRKLEEQGLITSHMETVGTKLEKKYYHLTSDGKKMLDEWMEEPLGNIMPSRSEFTMKIYLIRDAHDPLAKTLFANEIARHEAKFNYLQSRWDELFANNEENQQKQYGHTLILQRAITRERDYLTWLREEYEKLLEISTKDVQEKSTQEKE